MKSTIFSSAVVVGGLALLLGLSPQGSVQDSIQQLTQQVAQLGLRVDRLEHASGQSSAGSSAGPATTAGAPHRTMILAAVSQSSHSAASTEEISKLQRHNASLMNSVDQVTVDQVQSAGQDLYAGRSSSGEAGWGQASGSTVVSTNVGAAGRQVLADQALKERYSTQAYITRKKLHKLQAANAVPKQIIHGHTDKVIYTLETKTDLTDMLNDIAIGDTVTWTGKRDSADEKSESWTITSIRKVSN